MKNKDSVVAPDPVAKAGSGLSSIAVGGEFVCACGCGGRGIRGDGSSKWQGFKKGHWSNVRVYTRMTPSAPAPPCACGCGRTVGQQKNDRSQWNTIIHGHGMKGIHTKVKSPCKCGCGQIPPNRRALFIKAHQPKRYSTCHPELRHFANGLCKECDRKQREAKRRGSPARVRSHRARTLRKYGLTHESFAAMLAAQRFSCAICETTSPGKKGWAVDHSYVTGRVRGILCPKCNSGLGLFKDSFQNCAAAGRYLIRAMHAPKSETA